MVKTPRRGSVRGDRTPNPGGDLPPGNIFGRGCLEGDFLQRGYLLESSVLRVPHDSTSLVRQS